MISSHVGLVAAILDGAGLEFSPCPDPQPLLSRIQESCGPHLGLWAAFSLPIPPHLLRASLDSSYRACDTKSSL